MARLLFGNVDIVANDRSIAYRFVARGESVLNIVNAISFCEQFIY